MNPYKLTVGLEIHAELATKTKMFCNSKNDADEVEPNKNICPICLGYPGTLPVINKQAVKNILKLGVALGGTLAEETHFDRKNYFYPDIPKGYQISQYKDPLVSGGSLAGVDITRVHLEEDTARSSHAGSDSTSLLDFNRAGLPLMELVTEPVIHDAETASKFAKELQLLLTYLGIAEANMEKGEMRIEANVSVSKSSELGTKVEIKNLNSFKVVEKAIAYEYERQCKLLEEGGKVVQETRGWDDNKGETFSQRVKEESHDYRYFPDPDLPRLSIKDMPEFGREALKAELPELPWQKRDRIISEYDLRLEDTGVYVRDTKLADYLDEIAKSLGDKKLIKLASNYILTDLLSPIPSESLVGVIKMLDEGALSSRGAKDLLKLLKEGGDPRAIAEKEGLVQESDDTKLKEIAEKVILANPDAVNEYKGGKGASLQYLVGQAMRESKGSANPQALSKIFTELLK